MDAVKKSFYGFIKVITVHCIMVYTLQKINIELTPTAICHLLQYGVQGITQYNFWVWKYSCRAAAGCLFYLIFPQGLLKFKMCLVWINMAFLQGVVSFNKACRAICHWDQDFLFLKIALIAWFHWRKLLNHLIF